ncbi:hypothetical protein LSCM1_02527 [Leishmania martiniquensis]|uniref:Uncharacterized protein n=1 Tax=Leishmania martiniquensis TaxID=1580590 RepID=A0A836KE87_9TRYP|nr:hypothetical protein LSCM1_02527 [Leishmania martiniquensis]
MAAASARLAQSLQQLVDTDASLQRHILARMTARVALHESKSAASRSVGPVAPFDSVPLWSHPEGFPPLPHTEPPQSQWECELPLRWAPVEMVLMLDVFEVAQRSPITCQTLMLSAAGSVEASASAAVAAWLRAYVAGFLEERRTEGAVTPSCIEEPTRSLPWPWPWCAAMFHRKVELRVRVLLLRIPSLYAAVTSGRGLAPGDAPPVRPGIAAPSALHSGEADSLAEELSSILPLSTELEQMPSARLTNTHSPCCAYPCDRFLELWHTVQVVGVVHQVFYEGHSAALPAPWVTLLLLPTTTESCPQPTLAKWGKEPPRRCEVDLSSLSLCQRSSVAVIGGVVAVRGHAQVARRRAGTKAEAAAPLRLAGAGETPLEEYIVATWATPVQLSTGLLRAPTCSWSSRNCACSVVNEAAGASPMATMAAIDHLPLGSVAASPEYSRSDFNGGRGKNCGDATLSLTAAEEEAAARASLVFWEGARVALGVEAPEQAPGMDRAAWVAHSFSASLDFLVASQLALVSAQMTEGVLLLVVDEAVPESLLTRILRRLDRVVPSATLEVPSSILTRAKPSFFLPSYRTQRPPTAPAPRRNAPASAPNVVMGAPMGPPTARRALHYRSHTETAVVGPPPPCYPEVLQGGALTHANGRTFVLQRIEAMAAPTLQLLQEALQNEAGDAETMEATVPASQDSECAFDASVTVPPCTEEQQREQQLQTSSTNSCGATRRLIRREGGQTVTYCATHSALCSVRQGASLMQKAKLFEFAARCDIVLRPAYDTHRQSAALQGSIVPAFGKLLHLRGEAWLEMLGAALKFPTHQAATESASRSPTTTAPSGALNEAPTLSEACSRLLSTYFIAAKALCVEGADAGMMKTLVKLTVAHTKWRTRLTMALKQQAGDSIAVSSPTSAATALIDAVAAVGLCDATLHFFTAKTLLGECVFRLMESEAWPILASQDCSAQLPPKPAHDADGILGGASFQGEARGPLDWQQLYAEIEYRTRLESALLQTPEPQSSAFSILQLVQDLQGHLERTMQQTCLAPTMREGGV